MLQQGTIYMLPTFDPSNFDFQRFVVAPFLDLFHDIDGSVSSPLAFDLQLKYKEIPWHLIFLHYWEVQRHRDDFNGVVFRLLDNSQGENALHSLINMFQKIRNLAPLEPSDLRGLSILTPFLEAGYIDAVLIDLLKRLNRILNAPQASSQNLLVTKKIAILRFLQAAGEYFKNLSHLDFFKALDGSLESGAFRNSLSHLENLVNVIRSLLHNQQIPWVDIVRELGELQTLLQTYQIAFNAVQERVAKRTVKTPIPSSFNAKAIKILRKALSKSVGKRTVGLPRLKDTQELKAILDTLRPFSSEAIRLKSGEKGQEDLKKKFKSILLDPKKPSRRT